MLCGQLQPSLQRMPRSEVRSSAGADHVFVDITFGLTTVYRSGLQRVEREIVRGLNAMNHPLERFVFVAWDPDARRFHRVSADALERRETLPALTQWLSERPFGNISAGSDLFILASNWPLGEDYFRDLY